MLGIRIASLALLAALSACAGMPHEAAQQEPIVCRLTPQVKSPTQRLYLGWPISLNMEATTPPEPLKAEPTYRFGSPRYAAVSIGDKESSDPFVLVVDASPGLEKAPEICIYFDSNNNEDLTDDPPLLPAAPPEFKDMGDIPIVHAIFPTAQADIVVSGQTVTCHLNISFHRNYAIPTSNIAESVDVNIADYMAGTLQLGGQSFPVRLVDSNKDGRFDDVARILADSPSQPETHREADTLVVGSPDDDARTDGWRAVDMRSLADYLCLGGHCYALQVAPTGESITLAPPGVPTGTVLFPLPNQRLTLIRGEGSLVAGGPGKATVPAGSYGVNSVYFGVTDSNGDKWDYNGSAYNLGLTLNVKPGRTLQCPCGPPLTATIQMPQPRGRQHAFKVQLTGNGGERYDWGYAVLKNGQSVVPSVLVEDAHGREVFRAIAYSLGSDYIADGCGWDAPSGLHGRFKVTPVVDLGPISIKLVPAELTIP